MIGFLYRHRIRPRILSAEWVKTWLKRGWSLPGLLRYSAQRAKWRMRGATIAESAVLADLLIHGPPRNVFIGDSCAIGRIFLQAHDRIQIGKSVVINDGVKLITGSHDINSPTYEHKFAPIVVEDFSWIATDALILQGVTIGTGAVVSAGAVVTRNVESFTVVGGNPARVIATRNIRTFRYVPASWFGPVMSWVGRNPVADSNQTRKKL